MVGARELVVNVGHILSDTRDQYCSNMDLKHSSVPSRYPTLNNSWEFAGWGSTHYVTLDDDSSELHENHGQGSGSVLNQFQAISIAGNDLIASVFYTLGPCIEYAGAFAPISMACVSLAMWPFKNIICEIATALPMNGGTYNIVLNSTTKTLAAMTAILSILDYVATAVESAATAMHYLALEITLPQQFPIFWATIAVMFLASVVVMMGLKESANISLAIFVAHLVTMAALMIMLLVKWIEIGNQQLIENWQLTMSESGSFISKIFFGFCLGLLGMTGFESTENYIEDMKPNTFCKVMRNMWYISFLLNIPLTFLITAVVPLNVVRSHTNNAISIAGEYALNDSSWLRVWVSIDAVIILCAGALTGIVGITGLLRRMTHDRLLPSIFLVRNKRTGADQYVILMFFILCSSLFAIVKGDTSSLSGVFVVSFLSVMCCFSLCNILLKYKRGRLHRMVTTSVTTSAVSFFVLLSGLIGNIVLDPIIISYFAIYYVVLFLVMIVTMNKVWLLKITYWCIGRSETLQRFERAEKWGSKLVNTIKEVKIFPVVFFAKTDDPYQLNKAILYVKDNETTGHIKLVHFYESGEPLEGFEISHQLLDRVYPKMQIELILIEGVFGPEAVHRVSKKLGVPISQMFIACPGSDFRYSISELGGVRIIML